MKKYPNTYTVTFSYWCYYVDGWTRFTCGLFKFVYYTYKGLKTEVRIHRYNKGYGAGYIGKNVWGKYFNKKGGFK